MTRSVKFNRRSPHQRPTTPCLWCGTEVRGGQASYCHDTHREAARKARRRRKDWKNGGLTGCDMPDEPSYADRGLAVSASRASGLEIFVCKCGEYHVVPVGAGGESPEFYTWKPNPNRRQE